MLHRNPPFHFLRKNTKRHIPLNKVRALKKDTGIPCIFPYELCAFKPQIKRKLQDMDYTIGILAYSL